MKQEIQYYIKTVYGNNLMYIVDEEVRVAIQRLTGQRTLTEEAKQALQDLGFTFNQVLPPRE